MALLKIHLQVLRSHLVISTRVIVPKLLFLCSRICCRDVGPNRTDDKHSLEEHFWHVGSTTSTVPPLRVARLGWLPSQANLPLHDGWRRTRQMCHCSWNVKSTIRRQNFPNTNLDHLGKTGRYRQLRSFTFFALHDLFSGSCATSTVAPFSSGKTRMAPEPSKSYTFLYCMLAGIELNKYATGHEMSNQQWWLPTTA